jgi:hypothetical protein
MFYRSSSGVVVWESAVAKNNSREMTQFGTRNGTCHYVFAQGPGVDKSCESPDEIRLMLNFASIYSMILDA